LTWRAPAIKPGTLVLTRNFPLTYFSDNSLTAPLNWIYAPNNKSLDLSYYLAYMEVRIGRSLPSYQKFSENVPINQGYRNATFLGNTSQILVVFYSPPGCLRILDPEYDHDLFILPKQLNEIVYFSHIGSIITDSPIKASLPEDIFGKEPVHDWCYYFEKAELARQSGDWEQVVELGNQAFLQKLHPEEKSELFTFIDGYIKTGNMKHALTLANDAYLQQPDVSRKLCSKLTAIDPQSIADEDDRSAMIDLMNDMSCNPQ
jgi:hypothetical protein